MDEEMIRIAWNTFPMRELVIKLGFVGYNKQGNLTKCRDEAQWFIK